jgi:hypothetical protein
MIMEVIFSIGQKRKVRSRLFQSFNYETMLRDSLQNFNLTLDVAVS